MRTKIAVLLVIALGMLSLSACGKNDVEKDANLDATPSVTKQVKEPENSPIESAETAEPSPSESAPSEESVVSMPSEDLVSEDFLMQVEDVFTITGRGTVVTGTILSGYVWVGAEVELVGFGGETKTTRVGGIEAFRKLMDKAEAGDSIGLMVSDLKRDEIQRGQVLAAKGYMSATNGFMAKLRFTDDKWLGESKFTGKCYFFTTETTSTVDCDPKTLEDGTVMADIITDEILPMRVGTPFELRHSGAVIATGEVTHLGIMPRAAEISDADRIGIIEVTLIETGSQKVEVIKEIRAILGLDLKAAKELVDYAPSLIKETESMEEALDIKSRLEGLGAKVEITEL